MRIVRIVVVSLLLIVFATACAPKAATPPAPAQLPAPAPAAAPAPVAPSTQAPAKQAWEAEWEKVVEGAKKEGRILVYATSGEFRPPWAAAMEKYGVKLEMIIGQSVGSAEKITRERRAGIYASDISTGGTTTPLTLLKPRGTFDPMDAALILPEVIDPKMWYGEKLPFLDSDHTIFTFFLYSQSALAINTNLVKPAEVKSWKDLLDPKWRGKMAILDPTKPGTGGSFSGVVGAGIMGWDYLRKLAEAKPTILANDRQLMEWLAQGKISIAINPQATEFVAFRNLGAPVAAVVPEEGSWLSAGKGSASLFNKAAHPNAARVFLNWLLTKEGQMATAKAGGSQSARLDVPTDFLDPVLVRDSSKKYFVREREEFLLQQDEQFKMAREVFKDLFK